VALVEQVLRKTPEPDLRRAIGIKTTAPWTGADSLEIAGRAYRVVQADSPLQAREALLELDRDEALHLVLLTRVDEHTLGLDVAARLTRGQVLPIQPWQIVLERFQAQRADPRVKRISWMARVLLEANPAGALPAAPAGTLDETTSWGVALQALLGLTPENWDLPNLLEWSVHAENRERFRALDEIVREDLMTWLTAQGGPGVASLFDLIEAGRGGDAVPIGLVAEILGSEVALSEPQLRDASVRLEPWFGGRAVPAASAAALAQAAREVVQRLHKGGVPVDPILERADLILEELRAESFRGLGSITRGSFEARIEQFGQTLETALGAICDIASREVDAALRAAEAAAERVERHDWKQIHPEDHGRVSRAQMAVRLLRWLRCVGTTSPPASTFNAVGRAYADEGSWVDRARHHLSGVEPNRVVSQAYERLQEAVLRQRERENLQFAQLVAEQATAPFGSSDAMPAEEFVPCVLGPLAEKTRILLLMLDGMSFAVFREIEESLLARGWRSMALPQTGDIPLLVATFPSLTEAARASLLSGRLTRGDAGAELQAFAGQDSLNPGSRAEARPVLWHKSVLFGSSGGDLKPSVRATIEADRVPVIGAVLNAVDDHLAKGNQILVEWRVETVTGLGPLLEAARAGNRTVVLVSDHGHVPERGTERIPGGDFDRFRDVDIQDGEVRGVGAPGIEARGIGAQGGVVRDGEILVSGPRVLRPGNRMIALWTETRRYGIKKNGYHGGVSPQEMLIPWAVLSPPGAKDIPWPYLSVVRPLWWTGDPVSDDGPVAEVRRARSTTPEDLAAEVAIPHASVVQADAAGEVLQSQSSQPRQPIPVDRPGQTSQPDLPYDQGQPSQPGQPNLGVQPIQASPWIGQLLTSPLYQAQAERQARSALPPEQVALILEHLTGRGGVSSLDALARVMRVPDWRVPGILSSLARLLNLDGYEVLVREESSGTVRLTVELLRVQFHLE
jgi:hypothetical protein